MTVKSTELTNAMRRVLERMEDGAVVVRDTRTSCIVWGDSGNKLSAAEDNAIADLKWAAGRFVQFRYAGGNYYSELEVGRISPAGRKALKDS